MIFTCIGFNFIRTSKEKQKVILQLVISHNGFDGGTLVLIVSVPGHCSSFTFLAVILCFGNCLKLEDNVEEVEYESE